MIEEAFVSVETARLLKQKGFDEATWFYYNGEGKLHRWTDDVVMNSQLSVYSDRVSASTQQLAMRWLREIHNLIIEIKSRLHKSVMLFDYEILMPDKKHVDMLDAKDGYKTYEDACEAAIRCAVEDIL